MFLRTNWYCYVIEQLVHGFTCASNAKLLWMHLGVCEALKKLEPHLAIASCDSYTSFMLSNTVIHASVTDKCVPTMNQVSMDCCFEFERNTVEMQTVVE